MKQITEAEVIALAAAMAGTGGGGGGTGDGDMKKSVYDDTNAVADAGGIINYLNGQNYVKDASYVHTDNNYDNTAKNIVDNVSTDLANKVDKVTGKGLSTNDYTTTEQTKLSGIEAGAQVNVIEGISVNGTDITPDANKKIAITVITKAVNDLVNYYLKSDTYSKTEVDNIITAVKNSRFEAVTTLPTTDIETNVIYLVPKSPTQTNNAKDEYINLDGTTSGWEKIGDTEIDLSGYVTTTALNAALDDYTTTTDLTTLLDAKVNVSDYLTSSEVAALKALL